MNIKKLNVWGVIYSGLNFVSNSNCNNKRVKTFTPKGVVAGCCVPSVGTSKPLPNVNPSWINASTVAIFYSGQWSTIKLRS